MAANSETILIVGGSNGKFARTLSRVHTGSLQLVYPSRQELDLTMSTSELTRYVRDLRPKAIGIVGAFTNPGLAYDQSELCMATNFHGPLAVLEAAHEIGAFAAVVSTAMVFRGQTSSITEHLPRADKPPHGPYPKSKFNLELAMSRQNALLRVHCPIDEADPNPASPNFLNKLLALIYTGRTINAFRIKHTITSYHDAVKLFDYLLLHKKHGIYHSTSIDLISPAQALACALGLFGYGNDFIQNHVHIDPHSPEDSHRYPSRLGLGLANTYRKIPNTPIKSAKAIIMESFQRGTLLPSTGSAAKS